MWPRVPPDPSGRPRGRAPGVARPEARRAWLRELRGLLCVSTMRDASATPITTFWACHPTPITHLSTDCYRYSSRQSSQTSWMGESPRWKSSSSRSSCPAGIAAMEGEALSVPSAREARAAASSGWIAIRVWSEPLTLERASWTSTTPGRTSTETDINTHFFRAGRVRVERIATFSLFPFVRGKAPLSKHRTAIGESQEMPPEFSRHRW